MDYAIDDSEIAMTISCGLLFEIDHLIVPIDVVTGYNILSLSFIKISY